jgi:hypothetical protein
VREEGLPNHQVCEIPLEFRVIIVTFLREGVFIHRFSNFEGAG